MLAAQRHCWPSFQVLSLMKKLCCPRVWSGAARRATAVLAMVAVALAAQGCYLRKNTTPPGTESPFARLEPGMGMRKIQDTVGHPDDRATVYRGTGVVGAIVFPILIVWDLPLFLNRTDYITVLYYEGKGRIILSRDQVIRQVLYDPAEDGYR